VPRWNSLTQKLVLQLWEKWVNLEEVINVQFNRHRRI
jgi:hypothetical protein